MISECDKCDASVTGCKEQARNCVGKSETTSGSGESYEVRCPRLPQELLCYFRFTVGDLLKGIDFTTFVEVAPIISDFWNDAAIRKTYEQRNLFQIVSFPCFFAKLLIMEVQSDSCQYFFEHISRIAMPDFYPTNRDILFCRKATRGISEHIFEINKIPFRYSESSLFSLCMEAFSRFIDVGGQRSQRQKWFQCFTDITSILFMVASNEYDQVSDHDSEC